VVPSCLLGDEDVARSTYYQTTVQCVSPTAMVWSITKEEFLYYRCSKPLWDILEKSFTAKLINYTKRLNGQHNDKNGFGKQVKVVDETTATQETDSSLKEKPAFDMKNEDKR